VREAHDGPGGTDGPNSVLACDAGDQAIDDGQQLFAVGVQLPPDQTGRSRFGQGAAGRLAVGVVASQQQGGQGGVTCVAVT
jgi:hypothetical protein